MNKQTSGLRGETRIHTVTILSRLSPANWTTRRYKTRPLSR